MATRIEELLRLRDSNNPEDRAAYHLMVRNRPALRMAVGYEESNRANNETTN